MEIKKYGYDVCTVYMGRIDKHSMGSPLLHIVHCTQNAQAHREKEKKNKTMKLLAELKLKKKTK